MPYVDKRTIVSDLLKRYHPDRILVLRCLNKIFVYLLRRKLMFQADGLSEERK